MENLLHHQQTARAGAQRARSPQHPHALFSPAPREDHTLLPSGPPRGVQMAQETVGAYRGAGARCCSQEVGYCLVA